MSIIKSKIKQLSNIGLEVMATASIERGQFKALKLSEINLQDFFQGEYVIKVTDRPKYINGLLSISVEATYKGKPISINNPLLFKNPPILVPDGTVHLETDPSGNNIEINNYIEDLPEALRTIIVNTLEVIK